ncbi:MAG: peroxide stress protein YaaA, partial [Oleibacter sp.]|nr:peroxide stress protein YaaA [Thalassolituus sp.]
PIFKDEKNGQYKIISFYAKKARGMMASFQIRERITNVDVLKQFDTAGYRFSDEDSSASEWVFKRAAKDIPNG